jgi:hypothetical protein
MADGLQPVRAVWARNEKSLLIRADGKGSEIYDAPGPINSLEPVGLLDENPLPGGSERPNVRRHWERLDQSAVEVVKLEVVGDAAGVRIRDNDQR